MKRLFQLLFGLALFCFVAWFATQANPASNQITLFASNTQPFTENIVRQGAEVIGPVTPGVSIPVRDMPAAIPNDYPLDREINPMRHGTLLDENGHQFGTTTVDIDDPLVPLSHNQGINTPGLNLSFNGIGATGVLPPDTVGDVGPDHYVQAVNSRFRVWGKTGTPLTSEITLGTLFASSPGNACASDNDGDPIVLYDQFADKWLISEFDTTSPYNVCVAISQTGDPTGSFWLYAFTTPRFPDYFKIGVAEDGYYMGTNSGLQNQYDVFVMQRPQMILGLAATVQYFQSFANLLMPADADGATLPPSGSPGYFYTLKDAGQSYFNNPPSDRIEIYEFDVDWVTPANSTFVLDQSITDPTFAPFNWTVCGFFTTNCLPQLGSTTLIDSASWWPMFRLQYRNFGDHESMVGNFTVDVNSVGDRAGIRWFELQKSNNAPGGPWTLYQQGTFSPDTTHRFMGSIAMDKVGNIALGYSATSSSIYPSIRYTTRLVSDALGTMQTEATFVNGGGAQTHAAGRWGDYSALNVDPADDCTFWYTNEYVQTTGSAPWLTMIGSFTIPECLGPDFAIAVSPTTQDICQGSDALYTVSLSQFNGFSSPVSLTASGNPGTANFSPNPVTPPNNSTLTLSGATAGNYTFNIVGTSSGPVHQTSAGLNVYAAAPAGPTLTSPTNGSTGNTTIPTLIWAAASEATSYEIQVATDVAFSNIVASATGLTTTSYTLGAALSNDTVYYWRVRASNICGNNWSTPYSFRTGNYTSANSCRTVSLAIPDNNVTGVTDTWVNPGSGTIIDLDVVLTTTHGWVGDLIYTVGHSSPATSAIIIDRPGVPASTYGCGQNHIGARLDDEAAGGAVESQCAPSTLTTPPPYAISGTFTPNNPLSAFDGQDLSGTWTLNVSDRVATDTGTLTGWCLRATISTASADADYSDSAASYGVAWHTGSGGLRIGPNWTTDSSYAADGDNGNDDGVSVPGPITPGNTFNAQVQINGVASSGTAWLAGWFDWNNDGDFEDVGELVFNEDVTANIGGTANLNGNVPAGATQGINTRYRFRLYDGAQTLDAPPTTGGGSSNGEVTDGTPAVPTAVQMSQVAINQPLLLWPLMVGLALLLTLLLTYRRRQTL